MNAHTTLRGNLTRDPELKFLPSGTAVASFGLAVNRRWQNKAGEWEEEVSFFDITAFGQLGENVAESLSSGTAVVVTGRLQQQSWEGKDGQKRSKVAVIADDIGTSLRNATVQVTRVESNAGKASSPALNPRPGDSDPF